MKAAAFIDAIGWTLTRFFWLASIASAAVASLLRRLYLSRSIALESLIAVSLANSAGSSLGAALANNEKTIAVHVMTADGRPASGARLTIVQEIDRISTVQGEAIADSTGIAQMPAVSSGSTTTWRTVFSEADKSGLTIDHLRTDDPNPTITLLAPSSITVQLMLPNGQPAGGTTASPATIIMIPGRAGGVDFASLPPDMIKRLGRQTDDAGRVTFSNLGRAERVRLVVDDRFAQLDAMGDALELSPSDSSALKKIQLLNAATIRGTVRNGTTRRPAVSVRVTAQGTKLNTAWAETSTDEQGHFALRRLRPGEFNIELDLAIGGLDHDWTALAYDSLNVHEGETIEGRDLTLIPGVLIQGKAVNSATGKPIPNAQIGIYGPSHPKSGASVQMATSDASGLFTAHVPPGEQYIYSMNQMPGYTAEDGQSVTALDGQPLNVKIQYKPDDKPLIVGHVYQADGKPAAYATVEADPNPTGFGEAMPVTADKDGRFEFPALAANTVLRARFNDTSTSAAVVLADQSLDDIQISLADKPTRFSFIVNVVDVDQQPIGGASLELIRRSRSGMSSPVVHTDSEGRYIYQDLYPDCDYSLKAYADGFVFADASLEKVAPGSGDQKRLVTLQPAKSFIAGQVTNLVPSVTGIAVSARDQSGYREWKTETDADGRFRFEKLSAGEKYRLRATADWGSCAFQSINAPASDVKLRFPTTVPTGMAGGATEATGTTAIAPADTQPSKLRRLGVQLTDLSHTGDAYSRALAGGNVFVNGVEAGSLAEKMGLSIGDTIKQVNGKDVTKPSDVRAAVEQAKVVTIKVVRDGKTFTITAPSDGP